MPTPQNGETHSDNLSAIPTNCLSVFDHFVFDHKGLMLPVFKNANESFCVWTYVRFNFYKSEMYSECFTAFSAWLLHYWEMSERFKSSPSTVLPKQ